ncbi:MAG: TspO/MBR family protein [Planctomycetota bacterium]
MATDLSHSRTVGATQPVDCIHGRWSMVGFSTISLALLFIDGWLTYLGLGPWYYQLNFPPYQPPSWLFTPVWTVVLTLLAISTWLVARKAEPNPPAATLAFVAYGAQCVLNVGWSLIFFTLRRPDIALWNLIVLDVILLIMVISYRKVSKLAGNLVIPYFVWLLFATAINIWIVVDNASFKP